MDIVKMTPSILTANPPSIGFRSTTDVVGKAPEPMTPTPVLSLTSISKECVVQEIGQQQDQLFKPPTIVAFTDVEIQETGKTARVAPTQATPQMYVTKTTRTNTTCDCSFYINCCSNASVSNCYDLPKISYDERDNKTNSGNSEIFITMRPQYCTINDIFHREDERRKTFTNWPLNSLDQNQLAMFGMFYTGDEDKVKCYFCEVEIGRWEPEDQPLSEHMRWSPNCPLLRRRTTNNVPIDPEALDNFLPPISYDTCGINFEPDSDTSQTRSSFNDNGTAGVNGGVAATISPNLTTPTTIGYFLEYPEYSIEAARFRSYTDWPIYMKQKPAELAEAGFFYTGIGDRVKCFSCGGGLKDWAEHDEPWEQHASWMPACRYLKLMKGKTYIDEAIAKHANHSNCHSSPSEPLAYVDPAASTSTGVFSMNSKHSASFGAQSNVTLTMSASHVVPSSGVAVVGSPQDIIEKTNTPLPGFAETNEKLPSLNTAVNDDVKSKLSTEKKTSGGFSEEKICKICYASEYNTCFLPCSHVVACAKCASSVTTCPVCRVPIDDVVRLYFS